MKNNSHKKIFPEDKFARNFYCDHARLNQVRADKKASEKKIRTESKKIIRKAEREEIQRYCVTVARRSLKLFINFSTKTAVFDGGYST